jgi:hypothetical protein
MMVFYLFFHHDNQVLDLNCSTNVKRIHQISLVAYQVSLIIWL